MSRGELDLRDALSTTHGADKQGSVVEGERRGRPCHPAAAGGIEGALGEKDLDSSVFSTIVIQVAMGRFVDSFAGPGPVSQQALFPRDLLEAAARALATPRADASTQTGGDGAAESSLPPSLANRDADRNEDNRRSRPRGLAPTRSRLPGHGGLD
ncbi:hypothetical protein Esti_000922 [Eimeria stiedai]